MKLPKIAAAITLLVVALMSPISVFASSLVLSPATGTFSPGCSFSVDIQLDTGTIQTDGTDAILLYDQSRLSVSSITNGTLYPDYPVSAADQQNGQISISGLASVAQPFTGSGKFATINFKVSDTAPAGATTVNFDFDPNNPGKTTDSNVVERGTVADTLSSVTNGNYTIGTGTCGSAPITNGITQTGTTLASGSGNLGPGIGGPVSSTSGTLPKGGSSENTTVLTVAGVILTLLGVAGLALL